MKTINDFKERNAQIIEAKELAEMQEAINWVEETLNTLFKALTSRDGYLVSSCVTVPDNIKYYRAKQILQEQGFSVKDGSNRRHIEIIWE